MHNRQFVDITILHLLSADINRYLTYFKILSFFYYMKYNIYQNTRQKTVLSILWCSFFAIIIFESH